MISFNFGSCQDIRSKNYVKSQVRILLTLSQIVKKALRKKQQHLLKLYRWRAYQPTDLQKIGVWTIGLLLSSILLPMVATVCSNVNVSTNLIWTRPNKQFVFADFLFDVTQKYTRYATLCKSSALITQRGIDLFNIKQNPLKNTPKRFMPLNRCW